MSEYRWIKLTSHISDKSVGLYFRTDCFPVIEDMGDYRELWLDKGPVAVKETIETIFDMLAVSVELPRRPDLERKPVDLPIKGVDMKTGTVIVDG